jgi:hypothetical protein
MATSAGTFMVVSGTPRPAPQGLVLIELPKCCVLLTMAEFANGLKRAKAFKRRQQFAARHQEEAADDPR